VEACRDLIRNRAGVSHQAFSLRVQPATIDY
jgi:hypothetical protein